MPRSRTPLEIAAGKLTSSIQRQWSDEAGEPIADISENVMHRSHLLLQAAKHGSIAPVIGTGTVSDFLGKRWVQAHPNVWPHIQALEALQMRASDV